MTSGGAQTQVRNAPDIAAAGAAEVVNPAGEGRFVLVCEHASNYIPPEMKDLGLDEFALQSHIAWDPGAMQLAREMSRRLDSPLAAARISRLVYDCNRAPTAAGAIPETSENYRIPGNEGLSSAQRTRRERIFYEPFRAVLSDILDGRAANRPAVLTVHSFSPIYAGRRREVQIGLIDGGDDRLVRPFCAALREKSGYVVRRNAPYCKEDGVTHTLALHPMPRRLLNAMIEVRNDLLASASVCGEIAELLSECARAAQAAAEK